jgi:hypothetical protein
MDKEDISPENPSTANAEQLKRTLDEVAAMNPVPDYFFFTGDLVLGYVKEDTAKLASELMAWRKIYESSLLADKSTRLVTIPGNHELLFSTKKGITNKAAERTWLRIMQPYIPGQNSTSPSAIDSALASGGGLSYSFDEKNTHFLILNTDETGYECATNNAWIETDLRKSRAEGVAHTFVFSHIPAYAPPQMDKKGEQIGNPDSFWKILNDNKVTAMFSAHNHVYYRHQPVQDKTWMVIAGNGGSKLNEHTTPEQQFYGYTLVSVYKSGRVILKSMGRPLPAGGYASPASGTVTTMRDSADINWK